MNIKKWLSRPNSGFSLLELLVASAISSTVLLVAFGTIGQFYFAQKQINYSQDFYAESRFLMERITKSIRENTIDYDRFFLEVGPGHAGCNLALPESCTRDTDENDYASNFYRDTGDGKLRNLGGVNPDGSRDNCLFAISGCRVTLPELYLINSSQTIQTAFKNEDGSLQMQVRFGADTTNDGRADSWGIPDTNCLIDDFPPLGIKNMPIDRQAEFCARAHDWTTISPKALSITAFQFNPSPSRDPFLAFRVDSAYAQVQPHVFVSLETQLAATDTNGLAEEELPTMLLQTMASSRVFGDIRK